MLTRSLTLVATVAVLLSPLSTLAAAPNGATVSAPSSASSGTLVSVTGTSPTGPGTDLLVEDDNGSIPLESVDWNGNSFTISFYAPHFNEQEPDNEIHVEVNPRAPHTAAKTTISVTP